LWVISRPDKGRRGCGMFADGSAVVSCSDFREDEGKEVGVNKVLVEGKFKGAGVEFAAEYEVVF